MDIDGDFHLRTDFLRSQEIPYWTHGVQVDSTPWKANRSRIASYYRTAVHNYLARIREWLLEPEGPWHNGLLGVPVRC